MGATLAHGIAAVKNGRARHLHPGISGPTNTCTFAGSSEFTLISSGPQRPLRRPKLSQLQALLSSLLPASAALEN